MVASSERSRALSPSCEPTRNVSSGQSPHRRDPAHSPRSADAAEIFALEHRFPLAATLIALFLAGNVGSAVLMLL